MPFPVLLYLSSGSTHVLVNVTPSSKTQLPSPLCPHTSSNLLSGVTLLPTHSPYVPLHRCLPANICEACLPFYSEIKTQVRQLTSALRVKQKDYVHSSDEEQWRTTKNSSCCAHASTASTCLSSHGNLNSLGIVPGLAILPSLASNLQFSGLSLLSCWDCTVVVALCLAPQSYNLQMHTFIMPLYRT